MAEPYVFEDAIAEIASRLDLRDPNKDAIQTIAAEVSQHFDVDGKPPPLEAVIESATGVGKTYILAAAMELFVAAYGVRDFVIVTPGRTILEKTRDNFMPGHPKSLLEPMSFRPTVVTSDTFNTPAVRAAMDDESQVKLYLFTVQSLLKPESKFARKTHVFQEGLGAKLYGHLQHVSNLVLIADEHHCYYGPAFSKAVRDLHPWVLIGLTATPDRKTPQDQIIFRYPLAAAIADRFVKTPVIVGRRDDRIDPLTKLTDGVTLLQAKSAALTIHSQTHGVSSINPVMLVVAKSIDEANEYGDILRSSEFFGGAYADAVLVVHSDAPDAALEALSHVEDTESPVRIIISVGMLKEGWDVRNVYVIVSMRSSVSEILTEQTLGRGMRLPFGAYTGVEILDTLEVVAHERYEDLLRRAGVLNTALIDYRTRAALRTAGMAIAGPGVTPRQAQGAKASVTGSGARWDVGPARRATSEETQRHEIVINDETQVDTSLAKAAGATEASLQGEAATIPVASFEERAVQVNDAIMRMMQVVARRADAPSLKVPLLRMASVQSSFSLADITDADSFRRLGAALAANPDGELNRTIVSARVVVGPDGFKRTELVRAQATDRIRSAPSLLSLDELRKELTEMILASPAVPARKEERVALQPLLDAFFSGLGSDATGVLSANLGRAGSRLIRHVEEEQRRFMAKPSYETVVRIQEFNPVRTNDRTVSQDRFGPFAKEVAYEGWTRSLFPIEWFDSEPERAVANTLDGDNQVECWVRLHVNELPILWNSSGQRYNPDFIVVELSRTHWIVEVKMNKEMTSDDVQSKREAAMRWANHVSANDAVATAWRYLLVSESDVTTAKGSWAALKQLGQA